MLALVTMALAGQFSSSANEIARGDLDFTRAVEETIIAMAPMTAPPQPFRGLIEQLGLPSYADRQRASKELEAASTSDQRWLFWGRRHPDPEVRLRSNAILRRLNPCITCRGSGNSKNWEPWPCWDCQGYGTAWPYTMWD